jgi:hypothetical protein
MRIFLLITTLVVSSSRLFAGDTWEVPVKVFKSLDIDTAIEAEVICGDESMVLVETSEDTFDHMDIMVRRDRLIIERDVHFSSWFGDNHDRIFVTVYTTKPLEGLEANTAAQMDVESCAVSTDQLRVKVSTGASINAEGETDLLNLRVSTGGSFNSGRHRDELAINEAEIRLSTGASAGLCGALNIDGKLSTGAQIYASGEADVDVKRSTGADISYSRCR